MGSDSSDATAKARSDEAVTPLKTKLWTMDDLGRVYPADNREIGASPDIQQKVFAGYEGCVRTIQFIVTGTVTILSTPLPPLTSVSVATSNGSVCVLVKDILPNPPEHIKHIDNFLGTVEDSLNLSGNPEAGDEGGVDAFYYSPNQTETDKACLRIQKYRHDSYGRREYGNCFLKELDATK